MAQGVTRGWVLSLETAVPQEGCRSFWEVLRDWPLIGEEDAELCRRDRGTRGHTPGRVSCSSSYRGETLLPCSPWGYGMVSGSPAPRFPGVSFGLTLKLGSPALQQLRLNPRSPFCPQRKTAGWVWAG